MKALRTKESVSKYLAGKEDFRHFDVFQNTLGNSNSLYFIGIGIRIVDLSRLVASWVMKMARLDDDGAEGEYIAATFVGWVYPDGFIAEI